MFYNNYPNLKSTVDLEFIDVQLKIYNLNEDLIFKKLNFK